MTQPTTQTGEAQTVGLLLTLALSLPVALDFFDNASFSFFASHIAGGVDASADELVWSASTYAVASVLGILQQQWWIDRLGYRSYLVVCLALFGLTSLAASFTGSATELAIARGAQGYLIGPMLSACRVLVQISFSANKRSSVLRTFLFCILLASALAPLVGGYLVTHFGWQSLFFLTSTVGFCLAIFTLSVMPPFVARPRAEQGEAHVWPYLVFAAAIGMLQIVMQQVRFNLFTSSPGLIGLSAFGLMALTWFVHHQWRHPRPLLNLRGTTQQTFQTGLVMYVFYYYITNALGFLVARLLESGLGYPLEIAGNLVGISGLISLPMLFGYFYLSPKIKRKKWLVGTGYVLVISIGLWFAFLPSDVSSGSLILPLVLRGALLLTMALPVAGVSFSVFEFNDYTHSYRLKNIIKQLTLSFSTATTIMLEQHRTALHYSHIVETMSVSNPVVQDTMHTLTLHGQELGLSTNQAQQMALQQIYEMVMQQANLISIQDGFIFMVVVAVCAGAFYLWQRQI